MDFEANLSADSGIGSIEAGNGGTIQDGSALSKEQARDLINELQAYVDSDSEDPQGILLRKEEQVVVEFQSGPLPPASALGEYEAVVPGSAERIIDMAEGQAAHRKQMERDSLEATIRAEREDRENEYKLSRAGSFYAFIICMILVIGGLVCVILDKNAAGITSIGVALAAMGGVTLFNWKASSRKKDDAGGH